MIIVAHWIPVLGACVLAVAPQVEKRQAPDFNLDVRPILADRCFACHGPDGGSRAADLRLDTRDGALADLGGYAAVAPGDLDASELWARVTSEFDFEQMPPPDSHKASLSPAELDVLKRWIEEGAPWSRHWAFEPPSKSGSSIDELLGRRLAEIDLGFSAPAPAHTLARRLSFDLTGLPPSQDVIAHLGDSPTDDQWSAYVDRLLASPQYGERMAMWWLDGARYADTDGFQQDELRTNWPWRDWVVDAFNSGMPFDEFTVAQIAGDLLPDATEKQILATCFQRNHMHNGEGGRDPEESRVDYVRDRTNTMGTVWLGLTLECAQCHDHKFDPVSQRDYYSLSAFFDSIDESGRAGGGAGPFLKVTSEQAQPHVALAESELAAADVKLQEVESARRLDFRTWLAEQVKAKGAGYSAWSPVFPDRAYGAEGSELALLESHDGFVECTSGGQPQEDYLLEVNVPEPRQITGLRVEVLKHDGPGAGFSFAEDGEFIMSGVKLRVRKPGDHALKDAEFSAIVASVEGQGVDEQNGPASGILGDDPRRGWTTLGKDVAESPTAVLELREALLLAGGETLVIELQHRSTVPFSHPRAVRVSLTGERGKAVRAVGTTPLERLAQLRGGASEWKEGLREDLTALSMEEDIDWRQASAERTQFARQLESAKRASGELAVTVLKERGERRVTSVLERGVWDQKGETVERALLAALGSDAPAPPDEAELSRLELARWLVSPQQPLTARVIVNQVWQQFFGRGLVTTPGDFGLQGARPRYPEVLDWLAVDFVEHDWNLRHLVRTIVTSRVYAQSSRADRALVERDPKNELLARGARFRLPSWMIRDAALHSGGLLVQTIGGPPMFPHQPPGVWEDVFNGRFRYEPTLGQSRLRRTLYAFWRRNAAPTYLFDSADRRTCSVDLKNTNTPLQALTLLNDATYVEAAEALARRATGKYLAAPGRIQYLARIVLSRSLSTSELATCERLHREALAEFEGDSLRADALIACTLLNLDEAITHE